MTNTTGSGAWCRLPGSPAAGAAGTTGSACAACSAWAVAIPATSGLVGAMKGSTEGTGLEGDVRRVPTSWTVSCLPSSSSAGTTGGPDATATGRGEAVGTRACVDAGGSGTSRDGLGMDSFGIGVGTGIIKDNGCCGCGGCSGSSDDGSMGNVKGAIRYGSAVKAVCCTPLVHAWA